MRRPDGASSGGGLAGVGIAAFAVGGCCGGPPLLIALVSGAGVWPFLGLGGLALGGLTLAGTLAIRARRARKCRSTD